VDDHVGFLPSLRYAATTTLGHRPRLYAAVMRWRKRGRRLLLRNDTDLVIEGFPRSGNTFAVIAFQSVQPAEVRMAHHLHAPAHVVLAARRGIPTLVVVRRPLDAISSELVRRPRIAPRRVLAEYVRYHEIIAPYRDRFVVAPFEEVTTDYGAAIERLNDRFGTAFVPFATSPESVARVFAEIEEAERHDMENVTGRVRVTHVARPDERRHEAKAEIVARLEAPELSALRDSADRIHALLTAPADEAR
jgi:hypothetical protein